MITRKQKEEFLRYTMAYTNAVMEEDEQPSPEVISSLLRAHLFAAFLLIIEDYKGSGLTLQDFIKEYEAEALKCYKNIFPVMKEAIGK